MIRYLLGAIAGGLILFAVMPDKPPIMSYPEVIVREIVGVPDTIVSFVDRIITREVQVSGPIITAPQAAVSTVDAFCAPRVTPGMATVDTVFLMRSVSFDPGFLWKADRVSITGPTSVGDDRQFNYTLRGPWDAVARRDGVQMRASRWRWYGLIEAGVYMGFGYVAGSIR